MIHNKFWQAFFALAPLLIFFTILIWYAFFMLAAFGRPDLWAKETEENPAQILFWMGVFFVLLAFTIIISIGSLVFYIIHAVQNPDLVQNNMLILWILLFVFASGLGQLLYWILEIRNKKKTHLPNHTPQ